MIFLALKLADHPNIGDSLRYQVTGLIIVLIALAAIWLSVEILGYVFRKFEKKPTVAAKSSSSAAAVPSAAGNVDTEIAAVIAAAVASVIKRPHRIASIQQTSASSQSVGYVSAWAVEGRRQIQTTRRPR